MKLIPGFENALPLMALALILAGLATAYLTPYVRAVAHRLGVVDRPDPRRVNRRPVARGGGLAVVAAFVPVAILVTILNSIFGFVSMPDSVGVPELAALFGGGILAAVIGALDDYLQLRARWQLAGQLLLAVLAVGLGITVGFINNPLGAGLVRFGGVAGAVFTVFWIMGMINSINFIDGLDGLSSGIVLIAAVTLGIISLTVTVSEPYVAILCFALAGALLGFLRWNFHPATIFVGTSGVMFIGYTLALLSIMGTAKVAVAMLVLAVPIIDTFWIIVRRLAAHRSPFSPDRGHLHHRLLDIGLSHTQTVLLIYALCIGLALLSFVLSGSAQIVAFLVIVLGSGLALYAIRRWNLGGARLPAAWRHSDRTGRGPRDPNWTPREAAPADVPPLTPRTTAPRDSAARGSEARGSAAAADPSSRAIPAGPARRPSTTAHATVRVDSARSVGARPTQSAAPRSSLRSPAGPIGTPVMDPGIRAGDRVADS